MGNPVCIVHRVDPFTKKEWYDVKAPIMFTNRNVGKTVVSKTQGKSENVYYALSLHVPLSIVELASDGLKGRVFEVSLADLQDDEVAFRKFRLIAEEVQGKQVLTNFHGMTMTTDKLRSLVKKWQVL